MDHYPRVSKQKKWNSTGWFCPPPPSPSIGVGIMNEWLNDWMNYIMNECVDLVRARTFTFSSRFALYFHGFSFTVCYLHYSTFVYYDSDWFYIMVVLTRRFCLFLICMSLLHACARLLAGGWESQTFTRAISPQTCAANWIWLNDIECIQCIRWERMSAPPSQNSSDMDSPAQQDVTGYLWLPPTSNVLWRG